MNVHDYTGETILINGAAPATVIAQDDNRATIDMDGVKYIIDVEEIRIEVRFGKGFDYVIDRQYLEPY